MNCENFEARLNDLLDQRAPLDLDESLREHHDGCADCRGLFAAYGELVRAVRFRPPLEPDNRLTDRIIAAALDECARPLHRHRTLMRWAAALAVSAAILIAVVWKYSGPGPNLPLGPKQEATQPNEDPAPQGQALAALARDAASRYLGLARETGEDLSDVMTLVPEIDTSVATAWLPEDDAASSQPGKMAMNVAQTFEPLAKSTKKTLGFLFGSPDDDKGKM